MRKTACTDNELNRICAALPFRAHSEVTVSPKIRCSEEKKGSVLFGGEAYFGIPVIRHRLLRRCCYFERKKCPAFLKIGTFCPIT